MSVEHYENFPVASWLCPPALRPAVTAIYWFARTADDIADEGDAPADQRLADLADYRAELALAEADRPSSDRWAHVFEPLRQALRRHQLPAALLADLLSAFEQDVAPHHYAQRSDVLDYCRRSANPVGRLLLHLYGVADPISLQRSDAICTALQLANFWQDLGIDIRRGRLYIPSADCAAHGVDPADLAAGRDSADVRRLVLMEVQWARELMRFGAPLAHTLAGRAGWELRLVVQGGLRILDKIERIGGAALVQRVRLGVWDGPVLLWQALRMRAPMTLLAGQSA